MRIYIAGPMAGKQNHNIDAFNAAAAELRRCGHFVVNPVEIGAIFGTPDKLANWFTRQNEELDDLARCVQAAELATLRTCDAIYMLTGWQSSRGARKELAVAVTEWLEIFFEEPQK